MSQCPQLNISISTEFGAMTKRDKAHTKRSRSETGDADGADGTRAADGWEEVRSVSHGA